MEGTAADADFFKMFSYPLLEGSAESALSSPAAICISQKMAEAFFGSTEAAMGKSIRYDNRRDFTVTAVFADVQGNSSQRFDFLTNWPSFLEDSPWAKDWDNNTPRTFIQLRPDASPALVEKKITHFLDNLNKNQQEGGYTVQLGMQRFDEMYLQSNFENGKIAGGRIGYVRLFGIVAIFVLLIACINFMNLSTARSVKRAKEIGVRKVMGARRGMLIRQFVAESLLLTFISVCISLLLVALLLPYFNQVTGKQIILPVDQLFFWGRLLLITLVTGLVAGSYPALFLSSFEPVKVIKSTFRLGMGTVLFRKGLVVFQFVLAAIMIIGTIIVSRQVTYIQLLNLGYDRENLVYVPMEGPLLSKYNAFKEEAMHMPGIRAITRTSDNPTNITPTTTAVGWEGKDPNVHVSFTQASVGYDFVQTMKLQMANGRDFSKTFASDEDAFIINETALRRIGYKDPIGKPFTLWGFKGHIIGVVKDFHYSSVHEQIKPMAFFLKENLDYGTMLVRTMPGKTHEALASLEKLHKQFNPDFQFTYAFSDQEYNKLYNSEQVVRKLADAFAILAVFISCLGLLGLVMFTAEQRVKEIGIRKVLGAGMGSLFTLLSAEFVRLIVVAFFIALPLAWYGMHRWLQTFAYHTAIEWWIFLLSGGIIIGIALLTVSFHAFRAALVNPIKSLKTE